MKPLGSEALWELLQPLPPPPRRSRFPGRKPLDSRRIFTGMLFVLKTGIARDALPTELGCGCGQTGAPTPTILHAWRPTYGHPTDPRIRLLLGHPHRAALAQVRPRAGEAVPGRGHQAPPGPRVTDRWIEVNEIEVLNLAGNSEQTAPGMEAFVLEYLQRLFQVLELTGVTSGYRPDCC
jgi:transposase